MHLFHPELHPLFETLAYLSGYAAYKVQRSRIGDVLDGSRRWPIIAAAPIAGLADDSYGKPTDLPVGICERPSA